VASKPLSKPPVAVDIFSGAGGLTLGLKRAGFRVAAAVEIEDHAFATYKTNHPEVRAIKQDIRTVKGSHLRTMAGGKVDLLAGCPPCQSFSSLTNTSSKRDPRNDLILEMGRLVKELRPRAVMMENVPGLADRGKRLFSRFLKILDELKYRHTWAVLQVADYGVPQNRRRLVLLAGKGFDLSLPEPTHHRIGEGGLLQWKTLRDAIYGMEPPPLLEESRKAGGPQRHNWHVVRRLSPENVARLRATRAGASRAELPTSLRPTCHKDANDGYTNVYGRAWAQLKKHAGPRLEFNGVFGMDNAFASQLREYVGSSSTGYQNLARNQTFFANTIYSPRAYLLFSLELRHIATTPIIGTPANSNVIGIAAGYKF
jgi:DNA (cytosine-5)-methyltransferase 1